MTSREDNDDEMGSRHQHGHRKVFPCIPLLCVILFANYAHSLATRSYCATAHQLLESQGFAPKLRYFSGEDSSFKKPDGLDMGVMDFISEDKNLSGAGFEDVRKAIELLHNNDLVFGDLWRPNVLATPSGAMLIDFDWCGTVGGVHYPLQLNAKDIDWAPGVAAGKPLLKEHDLAMLILLRGDSQIGV